MKKLRYEHAVNVDLECLLKLRAAVGRFGEMDGAGWWNTQGVLGPRGAAVYKRGLPETHFFARVRLVSAVAAERSRTVYPASGVATLWSLPPALERSLSFQERSWATNGARKEWAAFESALASPSQNDLAGWLTELGLVEPSIADRLEALTTDPGGKGISIPAPVTNEAIQLLAIAHAHGSTRELVVPFIQDGLEADFE